MSFRKSMISVRKLSSDISGGHKGGNFTSSFHNILEELTYTCDPCKTVGDHEEAIGFCTNCEDYLCEICFKCHSRSKTSRHHALVDKDNMPRKPAIQLCQSCTATGNRVKATRYCAESGKYLCSTCFTVSQRTQTVAHHSTLDKGNTQRWTLCGHENSTYESNVHDVDDEHKETKEKYTYIRHIKIKAKGDDRECHIEELIVVSENELLLTDYNNKSLKLVDITEEKIEYTLRLQSQPIGITLLSKDQVAVVLENESRILIVSVSGGLFVVRSLNTTGNCVDIKYVNGKLYVSFWEPVRFQILQPTGVVYKTIRPDPEVLKHCILPSYIDVDPDESLIYMSDWKTKKVMSIDMSGRLVSMYHGELMGPADVTVSPFGSVYLCDRDRHTVYKLTPDLREATVVLRDKTGEASPHALCFNVDKQHLYISSGSSQPKYKNYIKIYQWK